ncbi:MAG: hypothetical protein JJU29_13640 [Verrucomicrobia bacterium]|nr:hypothetical protein [Verrucomicrobiota bacterium]MCH8510647.1 hypothetical protein [Kiritimatiellia bacterium]
MRNLSRFLLTTPLILLLLSAYVLYARRSREIGDAPRSLYIQFHTSLQGSQFYIIRNDENLVFYKVSPDAIYENYPHLEWVRSIEFRASDHESLLMIIAHEDHFYFVNLKGREVDGDRILFTKWSESTHEIRVLNTNTVDDLLFPEWFSSGKTLYGASRHPEARAY